MELKELRLQEVEQGIFGLFLEGNFEASLILFDELWDELLKSYVSGDYAVAIPSRDVLVFCDSESKSSIEELKLVIERVWDGGDHLLINKILVRKAGEWKYLD